MKVTLDVRRESVSTGNMECSKGYVKVLDFENPRDMQMGNWDKGKVVWEGEVNGSLDIDIPEKISYLFWATASDGMYIRTDPKLFDGIIVFLPMCEKPDVPPEEEEETPPPPPPKPPRKKRQKKSTNED